MNKVLSKLGKAELSFCKFPSQKPFDKVIFFSPKDKNPIMVTFKGFYAKLTIAAGEHSFPRPIYLP